MQLRRSLGPVDAVLFFVVAGSNLQWIAAAAAAGPSSLAVWLIGCLAMFVPLSIAVVFLSSHYPDEGGLYVWSKRAFGPFAGFITGWTYWASNLPYLRRCSTSPPETRSSSPARAAAHSPLRRSISSP
jgi:amino acid transporter